MPSNLLYPLTALTLSLLGGCGTLAARDHADMLQTAVQDDQTCIQQGTKYPEPRYVSCRMQLQDQRLYKDWMNLQLMHQTNYTPPYVPPAYPYHDAYRPLNPDHFSCRLDTENKHDYVLCSEDDDQKTSTSSSDKPNAG